MENIIPLILLILAVGVSIYTINSSYIAPHKEWHCTSYDYNADRCIQSSKRETANAR